MGNLVSQYFGGGFKKSKVIATNYGEITGQSIQIDGNRFVNIFLGIPFAKPPVGELRFQKPVPPEPWDGVRECIKHPCRAPQHDLLVEKFLVRVPISEDCLYVNVFAPDWDYSPNDQSAGRPVMMWIHGGGFAAQSSAHYGDEGIAKNLCSKDVIVVTIQYRLGILGFAATGDDNCIPNLGLWDQAAALSWIKGNISSFGGDPGNITVFGQSAGAASVDLLSLSPYTKDLFSKSILMAGSAHCGWAITNACAVRKAMIDFAEGLGWKQPEGLSDHEINSSMMNFLKIQPSTSLGVKILTKTKKKNNIFGLDFVPIIDGDFLPEPIDELRKKSLGRVCIAGVTEYEALLFASMGKKQYDYESIKRMVNSSIQPERFSNYEELRNEAMKLYVKEGQSKDALMKSYIRLFSDIFINNGVHQFCDRMVQAGHIVYLYNFQYCPQTIGLLGWWFPFLAATHCTELPYLFGKGIVHTFHPDENDLRMLDRFTTLFTNFAKFGDPNNRDDGSDEAERWNPLKESHIWSYLNINESCEMMNDFHDKRAEFWNSLTPDLIQ